MLLNRRPNAYDRLRQDSDEVSDHRFERCGAALAKYSTGDGGSEAPAARSDRPVIAIVGSVPSEEIQTVESEAPGRAAEEIGAALAGAGCDLMVYSSSPKFLEHRAVTGFLAATPAHPQSVRVRPPYDHPHLDFAEMTGSPEAFEVRYEAGADWEVSFYRSLNEVHGVVLIGGGRTTLITAMVGLAFGIPLAPLAAFGGNARKAWEILGRVRNLATDDEVSTLGAGWRPGSAEAVVETLLRQHRRRLDQERQRERESRSVARRTARGLAVGVLLLLIGLASIPLSYSTAAGATLNISMLLLGSLATATSGAIARTAVDHGTDWGRAAALGMSAGAIACLLFVTAQLATSPDILSGTGARRLLFFVLAVGFIAGFTFDAVYSKLRQQDALDLSVLSNDAAGKGRRDVG